MTVMSQKAFAASIKTIRTTGTKWRELVQEALVTASYYAFKDGDTGPLNRVMDAVIGLGTHHNIKSLTMWVELCAGIAIIKHERLVLNKKVRDQSGVIDEATFAPFETEMRKVSWWEIARPEKVASVFDEGSYIKKVVKKLTDEGYADLAEVIKQAELHWLVKRTLDAQQAANPANPDAGKVPA